MTQESGTLPAADERDLFVLRLAQALQASGYGARSLEEVLQASATNWVCRFALLLRARPRDIPLMPGVLLLVPSSLGYRSLTMLLNQNFETGLSAGVSAALIAFGLAGGLMVANVLVPPTK